MKLNLLKLTENYKWYVLIPYDSSYNNYESQYTIHIFLWLDKKNQNLIYTAKS